MAFFHFLRQNKINKAFSVVSKYRRLVLRSQVLPFGKGITTTVSAWCVSAHASFVFKIDRQKTQCLLIALNMQLLKKIRLYVEVIFLRCLKWGWMPLWMLNVNNRTSFPTISYNVPPNPILHLDSDQPLRMCSCKRISVFAISFLRMTFTSANFFNYDQTMAIACTNII